MAFCRECPCNSASCLSLGKKQNRGGVGAGGVVTVESYLSFTAVLAVSKRLWTVSAEAKYDEQSRQKEKNGRLVYNLA